MPSPRPLKGGSPQGTLLGNFLFVMATNRLEHSPLQENPRSSTITDAAAIENWTVDPEPMHPETEDAFGINAGPITSSPVRRSVLFDPDLTMSPDEDSFVYLKEDRLPFNRIDDSDEVTLFDTNASGPRARWRNRPIKILKYVDDFLGAEKLWTQGGYLLLSEKKPQRFIRAKKAENFFATVSERCQSVGMSVNKNKTPLLTVSASTAEDIQAYIKLPCGQRIDSQESLKILGFVFGNRPTVAAHVEHLCDTFIKFYLHPVFLRV